MLLSAALRWKINPKVALRNWMERLKTGQNLWATLQGVGKVAKLLQGARIVDQKSLRGSLKCPEEAHRAAGLRERGNLSFLPLFL